MSSKFEVKMPKLGESIVSAKIVRWLIEEGGYVNADEPLLEVTTDKVNSEIPAPHAGVLTKILAPVGADCDVDEVICTISTEAAVPPKPEKRESTPFYSPAVLKLAQLHKISGSTLEQIPATGNEGRLTKSDVERYLSAKPSPPPQPVGDIQRVEMDGMRKAIAENMKLSFYQAPHATVISEVDITHIVETIKSEKEAFLKAHGAKLTVTTFIARAIARALRDYPYINSFLDGDTIVLKHFVNLGIAVSVENAVVVPVIRNCHTLELPEIAKSLTTLARKARTSTLDPDDVKEGTITLTNFGMAGVKIGIPIIRFPEVAIIGVGAIEKKVAVLDDNTFGVRHFINITLTFDHRVLDGIYACNFLGLLSKTLSE